MASIERMRQKQALINGQAPVNQVVAHSEAPTDIVFSCGHKRPAHSMVKRKCPACIDGERRAVEAAKKKHKPQKLFRLPDKTEYKNLLYDEQTQMWSGSIQWGGLIGETVEAVFLTGSDTSVEKLCRRLGRQLYKLWQERQSNGQ